ncbi:hypothetical protein [Dyella silvatica]|uniref:hypothetical protein n=1 Tax=Dyella silvatica TaxID=2992128 RepID=UPI0022570D11|nr:hypothetical protein [Dyella silvatica]
MNAWRTARRYRSNLRIERDNAAWYARLAGLVECLRLARAYLYVAASEQANASFCQGHWRQPGVAVPSPQLSARVRVLAG